VSSRTIVINGDGTWRFVDLLWTHALDLYPPSSGVSFVTTVDPGASGTPNYRRILGNYPESFAEDPNSLENEIADEVSDLDADRQRRLSVIAVLSGEDFDRIAAWPSLQTPGIEDRVASLSKSGASAVRALLAAARRIADLSGSRGHGTFLATRLWLAVAVRSRGFEDEHARQAQAAMAALFGPVGGLATTFHLSNGRSLDTGAMHPHQHFVKLRLLIDVFQAGGEARLPHEELRGQGTREAGGVFWVRFRDGAVSVLDHSAVLQARLVEAYEELRAGRAGGPGDARPSGVEAVFKATTDEIETLAGDPMPLDEGRSFLKTAIAPAAGAGPPGAPQAASTTTPEEIALDYQKVRRGGLLRSDKRRLAIRDAAVDYETGMERIAETVRMHTAERVATEDREVRRKRLETHRLLAGLRIPESAAPIDAFRARLRAREAAFRAAVDSAAELNAEVTDGREDLEEDIADRRAEREALRQRLITAEDNLVGLGILFRVPLLMTVIVLVPFLVMLLGRTRYGTMPALDLGMFLDNVYPVPGILGLVLGVGLIVGVSRAFVMARRRDRARRAYGTAMLEEYERRIDQHAAPLVRAINRKRLSVLNLASSRMNVVDPASISQASDALIESLGTTRQFLRLSSQALPEAARAAADPAIAGFGEGLLRPDKVTGFLKSIGTLPATTFNLRMPGATRADIAIPSRTGRPPDIVLAEPGSAALHGHA
jgi:hypothetical protein